MTKDEAKILSRILLARFPEYLTGDELCGSECVDRLGQLIIEAIEVNDGGKFTKIFPDLGE